MNMRKQVREDAPARQRRSIPTAGAQRATRRPRTSIAHRRRLPPLAEREFATFVQQAEEVDEPRLEPNDGDDSMLLDAVFDDVDHPVHDHLDRLSTHLRHRSSLVSTEDYDVADEW
jgi:hypothetical protein